MNVKLKLKKNDKINDDTEMNFWIQSFSYAWNKMQQQKN